MNANNQNEAKKEETAEGQQSLKYASDSEYTSIKKNNTTSIAERISSANTASSVGPIMRKNKLATVEKQKNGENDIENSAVTLDLLF